MSTNSLDDGQLFELRQALFGDEPNELDVDRWHKQGFVFSASPSAPFGLIQREGGPCGILAPIQAFMLNDLIFGPNPAVRAEAKDDECPVCPSQERLVQSLLSALAHVLCSVLPQGSQQVVLISQDENGLQKTVLATPENLIAMLGQFLPSYQSEIGVLLFVYSVLLTRGIDVVRQDMDDPSLPLVGRFGHCGQELVNLMLTGRAVTNVFDGDKVLGNPNDADAFRLKGIPKAFDVGFLTLLEAMRYSKVGMHYKSPLHPIWVVGSSSHYTVLFSLDASVGQATPQELALHRAKMAFTELDPEENGFIDISRLSELAGKLALPYSLAQLQQHLDDGMGVLLWDRIVDFLVNPPQVQSIAQRTQPWACGVCTYENSAAAARCEMCDSAAPPVQQQAAPAPLQRAASVSGPLSFTLFHYNGVQAPSGPDGVAQPRCRRVMVTLLDSTVARAMQSDADDPNQDGLRQVIRTRWATSLVEYDGEPPKIE